MESNNKYVPPYFKGLIEMYISGSTVCLCNVSNINNTRKIN